jgi:hypothetical protein
MDIKQISSFQLNNLISIQSIKGGLIKLAELYDISSKRNLRNISERHLKKLPKETDFEIEKITTSDSFYNTGVLKIEECVKTITFNDCEVELNVQSGKKEELDDSKLSLLFLDYLREKRYKIINILNFYKDRYERKLKSDRRKAKADSNRKISASSV